MSNAHFQTNTVIQRDSGKHFMIKGKTELGKYVKKNKLLAMKQLRVAVLDCEAKRRGRIEMQREPSKRLTVF